VSASERESYGCVVVVALVAAVDGLTSTAREGKSDNSNLVVRSFVRSFALANRSIKK